MTEQILFQKKIFFNRIMDAGAVRPKICIQTEIRNQPSPEASVSVITTTGQDGGHEGARGRVSQEQAGFLPDRQGNA
jgi:hypothetical protein